MLRANCTVCYFLLLAGNLTVNDVESQEDTVCIHTTLTSLNDLVVVDDSIPVPEGNVPGIANVPGVVNVQVGDTLPQQRTEDADSMTNEAECTGARNKRKINTRKQEKHLRDHGQETKTRKGKVIPKKVFRLAGKCCRKRCYEKVNEEKQRHFHEHFYKCSKVEQNQILAGDITISKKSGERKGRGKPGIKHNRQITVQYSLKLDGHREMVCKNMFQSVYGLTTFKVDYLVEKLKHSSVPHVSLEDKRGRHEPTNKKIEERKAMLEHIERYPKYESHYSRRDSQKKYLRSHLNIRMLYSEYKAEHENAGSYDLFREVFKSTGYAFKQPHVDTCKTCDSYVLKIKQTNDQNAKKELIQDHNKHKDLADLGYKHKDTDKTKAKEDTTMRVLVFDLQQVLDTPSLTANVSFYKRLLSTYNLTIRDCTTDGGTTHCYMWHEAIGNRGSEDIASCVLKKLESLPENVTHVTTYSDTCGGQNRNINMACMFSLFVSKSNHVECVDQKFLVPGHTHLECDVDHARIERAKKSTEIPIMVPRDWFQFVRTVRGKKPFQVHEMSQEDFMSFSTIVRELLIRRTTDTEGRKINWLQMKWIRYEKTFGVILFKTSLDEENFRVLDLRRLKRGNKPKPVLRKCYNGPLPINPLKKKDLLSLLPLIHTECHQFYMNLETSGRAPEIMDVDSEEDE